MTVIIHRGFPEYQTLAARYITWCKCLAETLIVTILLSQQKKYTP